MEYQVCHFHFGFESMQNVHHVRIIIRHILSISIEIFQYFINKNLQETILFLFQFDSNYFLYIKIVLTRRECIISGHKQPKASS